TSAFNPTYWEGAVAVSGSRSGRGFLEMTRLG
ncbi:MAG: lipocalin family protein, partial [Thiohalorhabdaceae bacterium]